jgi:hypothetical protein
VDCPLATLLFAACAAIGSAMTAAMITTNFKRMNDAPYVLASFCRFNRIGKLELRDCDTVRLRTLFGPKR